MSGSVDLYKFRLFQEYAEAAARTLFVQPSLSDPILYALILDVICAF